VASEFYDEATKDGVRGHQATIVLGLPGSGKSTFIGPLEKNGAVNIDNDKIKEYIPEYAGGVGANAVHEEASGIARSVRNRAIGEGFNLVWERIDSPEKILSDIKSLKAAGYDVDVKFVDVSSELATKSAIDRFMSKGRYVSPLTIQGYGDSPRQSYDLAKSSGLVRSSERYTREPGKSFSQVE
jgi:predicted ABC-type ATPase